MIGLIIFFIVVFLLAAGFAWLADQPGSLLILRFGGFEFAEENLAVIAAILLAVLLLVVFLWVVITAIWRSPANVGGFFSKRRRNKGWRALADGMIAVGAGDLAAARKHAKYSTKYLPEEPVTKLLNAQTAQMAGNSDEARTVFETMTESPETRVVGYRGLFLEAEKAGEGEAARQFVEKAVQARPGLEWSGKALLEMQASSGDWQGALVTLGQNTDAKLYTKKEAKRLRAVLLTAFAETLEDSEPQKAKEKALEAHRLAPELVPAAIVATRVLSRLGDLRKASKVVETTWKKAPHPQLMDAYTHVRAGDAGLDRLKRAQNLKTLRAHHPEGTMGVARAHMDLKNWDEARKTLAGLIKSHPTERVCLMMSEIEEAQYGDRGRVREWLARAVRAERDPVWTADGFIAKDWAPVSPVTGELDAFEWRVPVEDLNAEPVDLALDEIPEGPREVFLGTVDANGSKITEDDDNLPIVIKPEASEKTTEDATEAVASEKSKASKASEGVVEGAAQRDKAHSKTDDSTRGASGPTATAEMAAQEEKEGDAGSVADKSAADGSFEKPAEADAEKPVTANDNKDDAEKPKEQDEKDNEPPIVSKDPTPVQSTADGVKAVGGQSPDYKDAKGGVENTQKLDATKTQMDEAAEDEALTFDDPKTKDPIDRPVIDDPGIKEDEAPGPRKKFRLF